MGVPSSAQPFPALPSPAVLASALQLTYEGLLDEVFGLSCGQLKTEGEGERGQLLFASVCLPVVEVCRPPAQPCSQRVSLECACTVPSSSHSPKFLSTCTCTAHVPPCTAGAAAKKVYGLNSADAVFRETRDKFYVGARKWLNETLRWVGGWVAGLGPRQGLAACVGPPGRPLVCWCIAGLPAGAWLSAVSLPARAPCGQLADLRCPLLALPRCALPCRTIQQFRDQGMHTADINQLRGFVAGVVCGVASWLCLAVPGACRGVAVAFWAAC